MFIIISIFPVNDCYVTVFLDASINYSFVFIDMVPFLSIRSGAIPMFHTIEVANGQTVYLNNVVRACTIVLNDHAFLIDLIPFWNG